MYLCRLTRVTFIRRLWRSVRGQQRNYHESLVSGNLSRKQGLCLGDHSSAPIPYHAQFHPFRSRGYECSSTGMRIRFRGSEQQTRRRYFEKARSFLRLEVTIAHYLGGQLHESNLHV